MPMFKAMYRCRACEEVLPTGVATGSWETVHQVMMHHIVGTPHPAGNPVTALDTHECPALNGGDSIMDFVGFEKREQ